jgi:diadenosine tetraphosphate (Ap4A) HIT family hydrolase
MNFPNQEIKSLFISNKETSSVIEKDIITNDTFTKCDAISKVKDEVIICKDNKDNKIFIKETYQDYIKFIKSRDKSKSITKDKWICDIIDDTSSEKPLYKDKDCIVIPTNVWDSKDISKLHILCIATDKSIRCIRSLKGKHIPLIEHMIKKTVSIINKLYKLEEKNLKINLHYLPSAFQFHIHFININFTDNFSSCDSSYDIHNVLFNLSIHSNYYQNIILRKCV